jgi:hypothetical protein
MKHTIPSRLLSFTLSCVLTLVFERLPSAQGATASSVQLGANLSPIADWSSEWAFVDAFKSSRPWIPQCNSWQQSDCISGWDTNEYDLLDLDEQGWVRSLPLPEGSPRFWYVGTLMFRGFNGRYPKGRYIVLYKGEGALEYGFDAVKDAAASKPGRDVINVTPSDSGIYLKIMATDPKQTGNYIRDIRVIMPGYEKNYVSQIFHPTFLKKIAPYKVLRFMNWMAANDTTQQQWEERVRLEDARYSTTAGAPLEVMIELANRSRIDPWFTLPHQATDEYIQNFAQLTLTKLDRGRKVYVEYSNEIWNGQFAQGDWVEQQGQLTWPAVSESGFTKRVNWYGKRTAEICDIWKNVWGMNRTRVVCVMAGQAANDWISRQALDCPLWEKAPCVEHGIDAVAIAPYFGYYLGAPEYEAAVQQWTTHPDGGLDQLFSELLTGGLLPDGPVGGALQDAFRQIETHATIAATYDLSLFAYEGGQHLVGVGNVVNNPAVSTLFIAANRDARMKTVYTRYLNGWRSRGGQAFAHFLNVHPYSKWGSWGALEYLDQASSPKYEALMGALKTR